MVGLMVGDIVRLKDDREGAIDHIHNSIDNIMDFRLLGTSTVYTIKSNDVKEIIILMPRSGGCCA